MRKAIVLCLLLAGCAEENFVPGSPLARMNGYNRTYEQIAAADCQKYGFTPGTENFGRCVFEVSARRREGDANYMAGMRSAGVAGAALYGASQPQTVAPAAAPPRMVNCTTSGGYIACF